MFARRHEMFNGNMRRSEQRYGVAARRRRHGFAGRSGSGKQSKQTGFRGGRRGNITYERWMPVPVRTAHARVQGRFADMRRRPTRSVHTDRAQIT